MGYRTAPWDWFGGGQFIRCFCNPCLRAAAHDVTGDGRRGGTSKDAAQRETQPNGNRGLGGEALDGLQSAAGGWCGVAMYYV